MTEPDFYLSAAGEMDGDLARLRACRILGRLRGATRDDYMLVEIDPPIIGQPYGLGGRDISQVILASRFAGSTLFPVSEWPCDVHVVRILDERVVSTMTYSPDLVELIAWARIGRSSDSVGGDRI